ncbi:AMP-binding protein [Actinospica durhamensis]|uniref:AMP-binding protein n=1 Tax=Actinospica durhamensis TaxID=1508375 RepID=A0A941EQA5_9ACTN|nr:AMP-binding protein [Actinospica durhamensis]MBR7831784.1 AMP-binding protein [Actinospica durhamensis]
MTRLIAPGARLVDAATGGGVDGAQITGRAGEAAAALSALPAGVVFTLIEPQLGSVLRYLGAWEAGRAVLPLDPRAPDTTLAELAERFRPALVTGLDYERAKALAPSLTGYRCAIVPEFGPGLVRDEGATAIPVHPDLGLLLSTSGSTGRPRLVRLSRSAVTANAAAIAAATRIAPDDVAVTALPLFYTYGLSVLNSHLNAGATVVLADGDLTARAFWDTVGAHGVSSLSLVPSQFEILRRLSGRLGGVRTLTASGGRLRERTALDFHGRGADLYVMYGQTEAGPRICVLPPDRLTDKLGSVGPPIPGVRLSIATEDGAQTAEPGVTGEVICRGPGVMMGYADEAAHLALPDLRHGVLRTGDLGRLDGEGHLWLTGRISRIGKVFGVRVNLAAVEQMLGEHGPVAAVAAEDRIRVWIEGLEADPRELVQSLADRFRVHPTGVEVRASSGLPTLPNGKIDYRALESRT